MSFDINWSNIYADPNINNSFKDFLNSKLSTIELPDYLANLQVVDFRLGPESPELSIRDIDLPFPEFYQEEEDKKAANEQHKNDEQDSGENTDINSPSGCTIPIIPLPTPKSSRQSPIPNYFNKHIHSPQTQSDFLSRSPSPNPFLPKRTSTPMALQSPKAAGLLLPRTNSGFIPTVGHIGVGLGGFGVANGENNININDNYSYKENYNAGYKEVTRHEYLEESIDTEEDMRNKANIKNKVNVKKKRKSAEEAKKVESKLEQSNEDIRMEENEIQEGIELHEADKNDEDEMADKKKLNAEGETAITTEDEEEEKEEERKKETEEGEGEEVNKVKAEAEVGKKMGNEEGKHSKKQRTIEKEKEEEIGYQDIANEEILKAVNVQEKNGEKEFKAKKKVNEDEQEEDKREKEFDIQLSMEIKWNSKIYIEVSCDLLVNYPAPEFIRLPVRLKITDMKILSLMIVAYISQKVFISFLCDINDEVGQNNDYTEGQDSKKSSMGETGMNEIRRDKGMERIEVIKDIKIEGELGNWDGDGESVESGTGIRNEPWKEIEFKGVQSESGAEDGNGLVLRNIGKIEKFLVTAFRGLLISELAWPSWIELDFNEENDYNNEEKKENGEGPEKEEKVL